MNFIRILYTVPQNQRILTKNFLHNIKQLQTYSKNTKANTNPTHNTKLNTTIGYRKNIPKAAAPKIEKVVTDCVIYTAKKSLIFRLVGALAVCQVGFWGLQADFRLKISSDSAGKLKSDQKRYIEAALCASVIPVILIAAHLLLRKCVTGMKIIEKGTAVEISGYNMLGNFGKPSKIPLQILTVNQSIPAFIKSSKDSYLTISKQGNLLPYIFDNTGKWENLDKFETAFTDSMLKNNDKEIKK